MTKIKVYSIGFTEKNAEKFFGLLKANKVSKIIDVRLNNVSQLAGFAKGADLSFFLKNIIGAGYEHHIELAPTKELLKGYRDKEISWQEYETRYKRLLDIRNISKVLRSSELNNCCFLCSENKADMCHRRILIEYLESKGFNLEVKHLK